MAKSKTQAPAAEEASEVKEPTAALRKTPTAEQRMLLRKGGDYRFDPITGELERTRQPAQPPKKTR